MDKEFTDPKSAKPVKRRCFITGLFSQGHRRFLWYREEIPWKRRGGPGLQACGSNSRSLKHNSEGILSMAMPDADTHGSSSSLLLRLRRIWTANTAYSAKSSEGHRHCKENPVKSKKGRLQLCVKTHMEEVNIIRIGDEAKAFDAEKEFAKRWGYKNRQAVQQKEKEDFLKQLGVDAGKIQTTKSGLQYCVRQNRQMEIVPRKGQTICMLTMRATCPKGKRFDRLIWRKQRFFNSDRRRQSDTGWDEAFLAWRIGEKEFWSYLIIWLMRAGYPGVIPPKRPLIFDVELLILNIVIKPVRAKNFCPYSAAEFQLNL